MNTLLTGLAVTAFPVLLASSVAAGAGVGFVFFRSLWWNTQLIVIGGRLSAALALTLGRFAAMIGLLTAEALAGAPYLLAAAVGVFVGRFAAIRSNGSDEP